MTYSKIKNAMITFLTTVLFCKGMFSEIESWRKVIVCLFAAWTIYNLLRIADETYIEMAQDRVNKLLEQFEEEVMNRERE